MTHRHVRDIHRLLEAEAAPYGASVEIEHTNGGHLRGVFHVGGQHVFIITSTTPSSTERLHQNIRHDARRALRSIAPWAK
jgi:hypothetical protein